MTIHSEYIMNLIGAGKSTLLDILALKSKSGLITGEILYNGKLLKRKQIRNIIG
jgi:ABC-type multidrug transport system ATPase subunit